MLQLISKRACTSNPNATITKSCSWKIMIMVLISAGYRYQGTIPRYQIILDRGHKNMIWNRNNNYNKVSMKIIIKNINNKTKIIIQKSIICNRNINCDKIISYIIFSQ